MEPVAFLITWTTYGTWLPGDRRGWARKKVWGVQPPDALREQTARRVMVEDRLVLTAEQRQILDETIVRPCTLWKWLLHARNVRTNHVHVVVSGPALPETMPDQFKAWGSRRLSEADDGKRRRWWTAGGDVEYICDDDELSQAIEYVVEGQ